MEIEKQQNHNVAMDDFYPGLVITADYRGDSLQVITVNPEGLYEDYIHGKNDHLVYFI